MLVSPLSGEEERPEPDERRQQIRAEQIRLLYASAHVGINVTVVATPIFGYLQWKVIPHPLIAGWFLYMLVVSLGRSLLLHRYRRISPPGINLNGWGTAFTISIGFAGIGWGAAGVLLYPPAHLTNQVFLAFVLGGMMLGAASLLAPRPEAFLAFLLPIGLPTALRFLLQGDALHLAMGLLAAIFTIVVLTTTWQIYRRVGESLNLRFENADLVHDLRIANAQTKALNEQLEQRVEERTAELQQTNEKLRLEMEHRQQIEEELLRARKLESLGVLAGGIAHDFNNFLTIVQGNIGLAKTQLQYGEPVHDLLDRTSMACQRAASLALQLLTFGKGGAPVRRIASVAQLVQDAVELARAGAPVSIALEIAENLWSAEVDASQISQALQNILLNAREAMPEGGIIEVRAENVRSEARSQPVGAGKYVKISVRDYGCGIPPEILPRVFDPYFTTKAAGTGLGLASTYAIVTKHQGHITVESAVGVETTFSIYLPACEQAPPAEPHADDALCRGSGRILVMDDEEALRRLLRATLEQLGYRVECARDGAEAIALYEGAKASGGCFDVVLLDLTVAGGMGGIEAARRLKEIDPSAKLIVSSGYSDAPVMSEFRQYGFDDVIPKPWTPVQMSEIFQRVLASAPERTKP